MNKTFFSFKTPSEIEELRVIHPYAFFIAAGLVKYCYDVGFPSPIFTSLARTHEENMLEGAESDSHVTMRAFDVSSRPYTVKQIKDIQEYMTKNYGKYGAENSNGQIRLVVYHKVESGAFHFHFQIHSRYKLPIFNGVVSV